MTRRIGMTSSGKRWALLFGVILALSLPKEVECGYPGGECAQAGRWKGEICRSYELEPFGFFLLESWLGRDIGFAYSSSTSCR